MSTHIVFYKKKQPLIAIPITVSLKHSINSLDCFPSFSTKRKLYKLYLCFYLFIFFYFLKHISNNKNHKISNDLLEWINNFKSYSYYGNQLYPVIIWSLVPNRKRNYIHFIDKFGKKILFAKLTSNKDDYDLLYNEYYHLVKIEKHKKTNKIFTVPKPISFKKGDYFCHLVVESLQKEDCLFHPEKNNFPNELFKEIQGKVEKVSLEFIFELDWWNKFKLVKDEVTDLYGYILNKDPKLLVNISQVHGDFGSENILINPEGKFKVIDWERSTNSGPFYLDVIAYWLGTNHKELKNISEKAIEQFYLNFRNVNKIDLALAISFLVGANFDLAYIVAKKFNHYT